MHLSLGNHSKESQQQRDTKEAKQVFKDNIRTDWEYPTPFPGTAPATRTNGGRTAGGFKIHDDASAALLEQVKPEVEEWCERMYASSDSEFPDDGVQYSGILPSTIASTKRPDSSEYLFEGPDSVGDQVVGRMRARKRRREQVLTQEMEWNIGLKHSTLR